MSSRTPWEDIGEDLDLESVATDQGYPPFAKNSKKRRALFVRTHDGRGNTKARMRSLIARRNVKITLAGPKDGKDDA